MLVVFAELRVYDAVVFGEEKRSSSRHADSKVIVVESPWATQVHAPATNIMEVPQAQAVLATS